MNNVLAALSSGLRGTIIASPGQQLFVADYMAIEARVLLWLADDQAALDVFRRGDDIYCTMAARIYDRPVTKADTAARALGKVAVLGLGYQMGAAKFQATCRTFGIELSDDMAQTVVDTYRQTFSKVPVQWEHHNRAAMTAVLTGRVVACDPCVWFLDDRFLRCMLPSGRTICYPDPRVEPVGTQWGTRTALTFMGANPYSQKWERLSTYGGKLVENITQAVARDFMAHALLECEQSIYRPLLSVHDEIIAEAPTGCGSVEDFVGLLEAVPKWGRGCPIRAEGWTGHRYHK